ncbi:transcriptional regulator [Clostridium sp. D33t1_170424_F3]|uniref:transcriptional regulator n=1 Tax=Clostridium sp. D33t1_170424_F3 TaxID=2787099 RepID=UPI0018A9B0AB|nr:transcriptional regulator [Clostridium sp. D33t1_170424_F3]
MNINKFSIISNSLRQYRRAELKDFEHELGAPAIDSLYVDPLPSNAVLNQVLAPTTTFLLGRKGTGKSTVFAKAQADLRRDKSNISVYLDVKAIYDLIGACDVPVLKDVEVSEDVLRTHFLRKEFLGAIISDVLKELQLYAKKLPLWEKILGKKRVMVETIKNMSELEKNIRSGKLSSSEIPVLQTITKKRKEQSKSTEQLTSAGEIKASLNSDFGASISSKDFEELLSDNEIYEEYSDSILRSYPFSSLLEQIKIYLVELGLNKLFIFFDDFSEINFVDQKLFVDIILAPLNNASNESIKLKIAGYPDRVYYGKIDPSKVDTINLDFSHLYKDRDIQNTERRAIDYTKRLLLKRFTAFGVNFFDYFDSKVSEDEYMRLFFECTFNVPRIIGFILNYCFNDRIARNQAINPAIIRLASQKYYEDILKKYFDQMNRFALEPFDRKLDRYVQHELLRTIVKEARDVRRKIITGEIGGAYFKELSNPPASHFAISKEFEPFLLSLELNFLISRYHEMRDKDGNDVYIISLFYGLCEAENIPWGYPRGRRDDRSYFVQRCFSYNSLLQEFLAKKQTIRCKLCGASHPMDDKAAIERYGWLCPECKAGQCIVVNLADDYKDEIESLNQELMLEETELEILQTLNSENRPMRANEISELIDKSYQLIGKRTSKLKELGFVDKKQLNGHVHNEITERAKGVYFS